MKPLERIALTLAIGIPAASLVWLAGLFLANL